MRRSWRGICEINLIRLLQACSVSEEQQKTQKANSTLKANCFQLFVGLCSCEEHNGESDGGECEQLCHSKLIPSYMLITLHNEKSCSMKATPSELAHCLPNVVLLSNRTTDAMIDIPLHMREEQI